MSKPYVICYMMTSIDGRKELPTVFERKGGNGVPTPLELVDAKSYNTGSVLIKYKIKKN